MVSIEAIFKIFADNPPSIAIALGGLMLLIGYPSQIDGLVIAGWAFFLGGSIDLLHIRNKFLPRIICF